MIRSLLLVIALGSMVFVLGDCKKSEDPSPSAEELQLQKLTGTWKAKTVTKDAVAQTGYDSFQISISGTTKKIDFVTTGRPSVSPWPASGVITFGSKPETDLVRGDLPMTYSVTDSQLQITFMFSGSPSRTKEIDGQWMFTLTK